MFRHDGEERVFANRYKMAPDADLNVTIKHESKKLAAALNFKRKPWGEVRQIFLFLALFRARLVKKHPPFSLSLTDRSVLPAAVTPGAEEKLTL